MTQLKMRKFIQNKLWRDKLIDILEKQHGSVIHWHRLNDQEFDEQLRFKLIEETEEVRLATSKDNLITELADIFEVIDALCKLHAISREDITQEQKIKAEKRGGFEKRKYVTIAEHLDSSFGANYCLADPKNILK